MAGEVRGIGAAHFEVSPVPEAFENGMGGGFQSGIGLRPTMGAEIGGSTKIAQSSKRRARCVGGSFIVAP